MAPPRTNSTESSKSPDEGYFNDLSRPPPGRRSSAQDAQEDDVGDAQSRAKRVACVLCRKRKLRCDGAKPSCATCARLSHECSYDEVRRKSGPKRGYVKALEARLAQVETLLKTQDPPTEPRTNGGRKRQAAAPRNDIQSAEVIDLDPIDIDFGVSGPNIVLPIGPATSIDTTFSGLNDRGIRDPPPQEIIGLGLEEAMPTPDVVEELNQLYFEKIHPSMPIIHRPRFYAALNLAPQARPPICLRYIMWAFAASVSDKYELMHEHFYQRARKYAERDEMRGHGEGMVSLAHVQAWIIIGTYEFKMTFFPRAWQSSGRASRLALMMGLNRLDGTGLDVKLCLPPPRDWTDREERRRTFWAAFMEDRYASIGTGWPMMIDENDILTNLPADEEAFENSRPSPTSTLDQALALDGAPNLSPFAGVIVMGCLFGRNLTHLHRPTPEDDERNLNGAFWKRHRTMDNILLNTSLSLPDHLRLPRGLSDAKIVFLNMCIHTSTICLHQAAIFKADLNRMSPNIAAESKVRCITAAAETASIMRMISHQDLSAANPFTSFCLYVAARVFVQYLKSRPQDQQVQASLHFILSAMQIMRKRNPLTESFLTQLDMDLESAGLEESRSLRNRMARMNSNNSQSSVISLKGVCILSLQDPEGGDSQRSKGPPTFGNGGLALHTTPNRGPIAGKVRGISVPDSNRMDSARSVPVSTQTYTMPDRPRASVSNPSPETVASEPMDVSADNNDGSTPSSQQNVSSRVSNTSSFTPPSLHQDSTQNNWDSQNIESERRAIHIPTNPSQATMLFDPLDSSYSDLDYNQFSGDSRSGLTAGMTGTENSAFGFSGFSPAEGIGLTPAFSGGTGFTPGPSADMLGMSDAEWKQLLDGGMLDMNWETGFSSSSRA